MRQYLVSLAALLLLPVLSAAQEQPADQPDQKTEFSEAEYRAAQADPKFYTLDAKTVEIVNLGPVVAPQQTKPPSRPSIPSKPTIPSIPRPGSGSQDPLIIIDKIINIGLKVWKFIEDNKPVVDITTEYANAVPDGITHWTQLGEWKPPVGTKYGFYAKNGYGVKVVQAEYVVFRTYGGTYKGKGKYLTGVTVEPTKVVASWGYKVNMACSVPSVANVGTSEDPIASMMAKLNWTISTVIKSETGTSVYYVQGDGAFRELAGPFSVQSREKVKKKIKQLELDKKVVDGSIESVKGGSGLQ